MDFRLKLFHLLSAVMFSRSFSLIHRNITEKEAIKCMKAGTSSRWKWLQNKLLDGENRCLEGI